MAFNNLLVGGVHCLCSPLPLNRSTTHCSPSNTLTTKSTSTSTNPDFSVEEYLVQSCGLSSDVALRASKHLHHLKSPHKPHAVLRFLRDLPIHESHIQAAVSRDPRLLCSSVDNIWRPNIAKLRELGYSLDQISAIIVRCTYLFRRRIATKIDFWLGLLGSVHNLSVVLKRCTSALQCSLNKTLVPNLSFLQDQCGLSADQIAQLVKLAPRLIIFKPQVLKITVRRADQLGIPRSSGAFLYALVVVSKRSQDVIDARLSNLRSFGFSQEEVTFMICKTPLLLGISEEVISRKMKFLIKEAECSLIDVVQYTSLLTLSLENRLLPRTLVRKLLRSKRLPVANQKFGSFMLPSEEKFLKKFVLPYEHAIPGLHQAYAQAGNVEGIH